LVAEWVTPSWVKVPKCDNATVTAQRSAAQNGQDSSLTKTIAGLPPTVSGGPAVWVFRSGVITRAVLARVSMACGTVVTCWTTAAGAADSLAGGGAAGDEVSLTATSATTTAATAATDPIASKIRRRASARFRAARSAAIRSRARCRDGGPCLCLVDLAVALRCWL
jgi:hypothetical protein